MAVVWTTKARPRKHRLEMTAKSTSKKTRTSTRHRNHPKTCRRAILYTCLQHRAVAVTLRCGQGSTGAASSAEAVRPASAPSMGSGGGGWSDMEVEEMPSPGDGRNDATKETPKFVS